jgi:hypothetical protein
VGTDEPCPESAEYDGVPVGREKDDYCIPWVGWGMLGKIGLTRSRIVTKMYSVFNRLRLTGLWGSQVKRQEVSKPKEFWQNLSPLALNNQCVCFIDLVDYTSSLSNLEGIVVRVQQRAVSN